MRDSGSSAAQLLIETDRLDLDEERSRKVLVKVRRSVELWLAHNPGELLPKQGVAALALVVHELVERRRARLAEQRLQLQQAVAVAKLGEAIPDGAIDDEARALVARQLARLSADDLDRIAAAKRLEEQHGDDEAVS